MASIGEVARRAGVSITTVSRVLNPVSEYPVAAATRRRVLAAAAALQYSPSALARALVTRRSRMVGVLLGDIADPYFAEIVRGIEDVARRSGYLVVVCNTSRDPGTERRYVTALRDYRADAIIFLGGDIFDAPTRRALERELISLTSYGAVALAVAGDHADLPAIDIDHTAGAEDMVRYLIGLGHARIGYISGPLTVSTARYRHQGYINAMTAAGLAADLVEEGDFAYAGGQAAALELLKREPTAIFAGNDQMALGVLAACRACAIAVPGDVSVVGFGNTSAAEHAVPALTTVSMPRHQLGVEAMQAVIDALELEKPRIYPRRLPFHLVIRESSGPPLLARIGKPTRRRARSSTAASASV
ncbi:MAG: LacI family transcriptional regulator [Chloroflexi bacterium]|nr:MAG: LacI family transcriptional regulator [Chloroflexota bacterium]TME95071.1 MAG: LacI family transcriptional regulator [Chloroflexota bacterium]